MKKYRVTAFTALSILTPLILLSIYRNDNASAEESQTAIPVKTITLTPEPFQPTERFSGFLQSENQTDIRANISGRVISIRKNPGETVREGETLAILAEESIASANTSAAHSVSAARETVDAIKRYYDQKINEAEASLKKTKESERAGDATKKDVSVAEETVASAKKLRDAELSRAESTLVSAQGNELMTQASARDLIIRAPFSGIILRRDINIGSRVFPSDMLFSIASTENYELPISVPVSIARQISAETPLNLFTEESKTPLSGSIDSYAPASSNQTGETLVRIRTRKNENNPLPPIGSFIEAEFPLQEKRDAIVIPASAIVFRYGDPIVFIIREGRAKATGVELGQTIGNRREIISGLQTGDTLVTAGMHLLRENAIISISPEIQESL